MMLAVTIFIGIFYWPIAVVWIVLYGGIGGMIFKYFSCWQEFYVWVRKDIREWLHYPDRAYNNYINYLLDHEMTKSNHDTSYQTKDRNELMALYPKAPFPILRNIALWWIVMCFSPIRAFAGMVEGPQIVFNDCLEIWTTYILGHDRFDRYRKLLEGQTNV